jgi:tetratricopeptide (TPR) repeat protein
LRDVDHAIALNPSLARAHQYRSAVLMVMGKFSDAVEAARRAQHLDPLSAAENTTLGVRLYYAGRYQEAVEQFTHAIETTPEFAVAHWGLGETHLQEGRTTEAIAELRRAVTLSQDSAYMRAWLAHALASAGQQDEAGTIRRDLEHLASERYVSLFLFALIAAGSRDQEETLAWLQRTAAAGSGWIPFLPVEPEFAWLRKRPGFSTSSPIHGPEPALRLIRLPAASRPFPDLRRTASRDLGRRPCLPRVAPRHCQEGRRR